MKFEVGDAVKVRRWKDICCEGVTSSDGSISFGKEYCFILNMKRYCGKQTIIENKYESSYDLYDFSYSYIDEFLEKEAAALVQCSIQD